MDAHTMSHAYWKYAEASGSALMSFYQTGDHNDYTSFVHSCQKWADIKDISFVEAANQIHYMFNINPGAKYANV